jgi:hypothetical protein
MLKRGQGKWGMANRPLVTPTPVQADSGTQIQRIVIEKKGDSWRGTLYEASTGLTLAFEGVTRRSLCDAISWLGSLNIRDDFRLPMEALPKG